jgi:hypothetical protein
MAANLVKLHGIKAKTPANKKGQLALAPGGNCPYSEPRTPK